MMYGAVYFTSFVYFKSIFFLKPLAILHVESIEVKILVLVGDIHKQIL